MYIFIDTETLLDKKKYRHFVVDTLLDKRLDRVRCGDT